MNLKNRIPFKINWLVIVLALIFTSCEKESRIVVLELDIAELVCVDGQKIFEGRILELEGIKTVSANIQTHKAQIRYRDNQVSAAEIKAHLGDFGFTIDNVPGNDVARGRLPQCCFTPQALQ
ncbi:MAG: hypothetical protein H8E26_08170 [FCB group bacterium]|nr:hypothetical protein [FCB group bacterium]MBL7027804.1 hypothetical protein [Candidatus Neomarinimicrobiota bacterium]MBL7120885.1 hypothetical protein [Candidatus Neomarinimicrobiota bacterium]